MTETRQAVSRHTALVTGASSGIGSELARLFAKDGHDVVLVARRGDRLAALATELESRHSVNATVLAKDLSDPRSAREICDRLQEERIQIEYLVNNAGFNVYGRFVETEFDEELKMLQVNIVSLAELTKLFAPSMVARGSGRILNLGSTGAFAPTPFSSLYGASKAFILSFSEALAEELRGSGVTVTVLCPGATETEFAVRAQMLDTRLFRNGAMGAAEVANIGYRAMMRGRTAVIAGLRNRVMVSSMRFSPRSAIAKISKQMMRRSNQA